MFQDYKRLVTNINTFYNKGYRDCSGAWLPRGPFFRSSGKMAELLEMKEAVVSYLDRSGGLRRFIEDCKVLGGGYVATPTMTLK